MHKATNAKHYVFSHLYPVEKDGIYKPGIGYMFRLRSADPSFLNKMNGLLNGLDYSNFIVLHIETRPVPKGRNNAIRTLTPFVITLKDKEKKYWKANESHEDIKALPTNNILHKYKQWCILQHKSAEECKKRYTCLPAFI